MAKVINLKAIPSQVSYLAFPVNGIVEGLRPIYPPVRPTKGELGGPSQAEVGRPLQPGDSVTKFDFVHFYAGLSQTSGATPSSLIYDSAGILNATTVQASLLMTLRAESAAAVLDKAIRARQNAYYAKYANQQQIISVMQAFYQQTSLPTAVNVVNTTNKPAMLIALRNLAQSLNTALQTAYTTENQGGVVQTSVFDSVSSDPSIASTVQNLRTQIALIDQQFAQFVSTQNYSHLDQVFTNEKESIDLDVKRLQIAYLNTILMSPINGIVTGIYKNPGDWVQAGEPAIRVEDNTVAILAGTLKYAGPISIGSQLTINTALFGATPTTIVGGVIAVRGHPSEEDLWDVRATYSNVPPNPVLPINYHFDFDDTSIAISDPA